MISANCKVVINLIEWDAMEIYCANNEWEKIITVNLESMSQNA